MQSPPTARRRYRRRATALVRRAPVPLLAAALLVAVPAAAAAAAPPGPAAALRLMKPPDSPARQQLAWLLDVSARLPMTDAEWRAHVASEFLTVPGASAPEVNAALLSLGGMRLARITHAQPDAVVAGVTTGDGRQLRLVLAVDAAGMIEHLSLQPPAGPRMALPAPTGGAPVGTDVVEVVDRLRGGRRLAISRWYPATRAARSSPRAAYASPLLSATFGLPPVRVTAHVGAQARPGRLPVVLFSPGYGTPRILYQALAEDLASHGYLVLAIDHTGEAPLERPHGDFEPRAAPPRHPLRTAAVTRLADMRLVLDRLDRMGAGPRADRRRVAAIGHSLGGSTAAALIRAVPRIRAGVDMDGSIVGAAGRRGVRRPFLVMAGADGLDRTIRGLLEQSRGPRLALTFGGLEHMSFTDLPAIAPEALGATPPASARDIAAQRAFLRAFLDRYVRGRRSPLLEGRSTRWPRVRVTYRARCCG